MFCTVWSGKTDHLFESGSTTVQTTMGKKIENFLPVVVVVVEVVVPIRNIGIFSSHSGMHVILPSTNRAFFCVKLSQAHKQKDIHNLHPHKRSVMPEVRLPSDLSPTHSSTPRMFFHSLHSTVEPTWVYLRGLYGGLSQWKAEAQIRSVLGIPVIGLWLAGRSLKYKWAASHTHDGKD